MLRSDPTPNARAERGFSMFLVDHGDVRHVDVRRGGFAAANGDLPESAGSESARSAYAAAEAGLATTSSGCARTRTTGRSATPPRAERRRAQPDQPAVDGPAPTPASGARSPASPTSTRSSCCTPPKYDQVRPRQAGDVRRHVHRHVQDQASPAAHTGTTKGAKRTLDRDVPARQLPQVRLLHQLGEPRPAGRAQRLRPRAPAEQLRQPEAHGARRQGLRRDPVPDTTPSTARCTPTTRACWSAARRASGARSTRTAPRA